MKNEYIKKGDVAYAEKDYQTAIQYYSKCINCNELEFEDANRKLVKIYKNILFLYPEAINCLKVLESLLIKKYGDCGHEIAELYQEISLVYEKMENYDLSIEWLEKAIKIFDIIDDDEYDEIANNYEQLSELNEKARYYEKAFEHYKYSIKANGEFWKGDMDPDRFNYYPKILTLGIKSKKHNEIYDYAKQTYQAELNISDYEDFNMINIYKFITCLSYKIDGFEEFNKNYDKLFNIAKEYGEETCGDETKFILELYRDLGDIFVLLDERKIALEQYYKALEGFKLYYATDEEKFKLYYSICKLFTDYEEYNEAIKYSDLMIAIDEDIIEEVSFEMDIDIYFERVSLYIKLELHNEAFYELNKFRDNDKYKNPIYNSEICYNMGVVFEKMGKNEEAVKYYSLAVDKIKMIYGVEHPKSVDIIDRISRLI